MNRNNGKMCQMLFEMLFAWLCKKYILGSRNKDEEQFIMSVGKFISAVLSVIVCCRNSVTQILEQSWEGEYEY